VSRARLFRSLKALDLEAVAAVLAARPELLRVTDDRRRGPLHFLCSLPANPRTTERSIKLARHLLGLGVGIDAPAFVEGAFRATPLWYAISRGRNLPLARFLLQEGSTPEYCLWAAGFADDVEAIDLLVRHGASLDPVTEDETPFLSAIKWSHFAAAERLLHHGANVNFQDSKGLTALHLVLKKTSAPRHVEMLMRHGADPTLRSRDGKSPLDLVAKRRDKTYLKLLSRGQGGPKRAIPNKTSPPRGG
jgi:ankyrin repeat protein